ncbi:MAG: hypothetical protein JW959_14695 [Pirellulales bacterium]|nr:hypothetical protein [Pirellulales bacterium]
MLDSAQAGEIKLCVVPQNLVEFYAVVTDDRRISPPRRPAEALDAIERFISMTGLLLLPTPVDLVERWVALMRRCPATRGAAFDVQLVAAMLGNGVRKIYTLNHSDFRPFDEIEVLAP